MNCEKQALFTVELKILSTKPPCGFDAAFFTTVFRVVEKLCAVRVFKLI